MPEKKTSKSERKRLRRKARKMQPTLNPKNPPAKRIPPAKRAEKQRESGFRDKIFYLNKRPGWDFRYPAKPEFHNIPTRPQAQNTNSFAALDVERFVDRLGESMLRKSQAALPAPHRAGVPLKVNPGDAALSRDELREELKAQKGPSLAQRARGLFRRGSHKDKAFADPDLEPADMQSRPAGRMPRQAVGHLVAGERAGWIDRQFHRINPGKARRMPKQSADEREAMRRALAGGEQSDDSRKALRILERREREREEEGKSDEED